MAECGTLTWRTAARFPSAAHRRRRTLQEKPEPVLSDSKPVSASAPGGSPVRVALLGCGVVGGAVARRLGEHSGDLAARVGAPLELVGVAVRRLGRDRSASKVPEALFTTDAEDLVTRADVVVEVI